METKPPRAMPTSMQTLRLCLQLIWASNPFSVQLLVPLRPGTCLDSALACNAFHSKMPSILPRYLDKTYQWRIKKSAGKNNSKTTMLRLVVMEFLDIGLWRPSILPTTILITMVFMMMKVLECLRVMEYMDIGINTPANPCCNGYTGNGHYIMINYNLIRNQIRNIIGSIFLWRIVRIPYMV